MLLIDSESSSAEQMTKPYIIVVSDRLKLLHHTAI